MGLEVVHDLPVVEDFTLLSDHEQETPHTYFGARPVLHLRCSDATIRVPGDDMVRQAVLATLMTPEFPDRASTAEDYVINHVDVWVGSNQLSLVAPAKELCISVLYPSITIHAKEGDAVLLGLNLSDANTPDDELVFIQLRIIPSSIEDYSQQVDSDRPEQTNGDSAHSADPAEALFKAIAACQELNPDPPEEGDEEFDETAPGATGWITSENMQDYLDENGELRIPQDATFIDGEAEEQDADEPHWPLGQGAGRTRRADDIDAADGAEDETKWRKTS